MARIELSNIGGGGTTLSLTTTGTSGASTLAGSVLNIPIYQGQLTLTTTGTSGAATLVGDTLNIPQYSGGGGTPAGNAGEVQFNSTPAGSFAASSNLSWDNAAVQLNIGAPSSPTGKLNVKGGGTTSATVNLRLTDSGNTELVKVLDNGSTNIGTNFNWDNANFRLSIGAPTLSNATLNVKGAGNSNSTNSVRITNSANTEVFRITDIGKIFCYATNTPAGTTGARTIDRPSGTVNFAIGASALVVTSSLCTTSSIVFATVRTNDATAYIKNVVPAAGSFTINLGANATAETSVGFFIIN